ncbi:PPE family protein [Mycobacterium tuberculosis]|nr:PPE family protein [Mycobacterium tuberculosis]
MANSGDVNTGAFISGNYSNGAFWRGDYQGLLDFSFPVGPLIRKPTSCISAKP